MARIVLADDDPNVRALVGIALRRAGHEVEEASDGREAMSLIERDPPDLLITDILMPEKEGIETIVEVRRRFPDVRIVAMSGGGRVEAEHYLDTADGFGADTTIRKPFDQKAMLAIVDDLCRHRSGRRRGGLQSPGGGDLGP
jgi:DNA-binding response OmpR family regulator